MVKYCAEAKLPAHRQLQYMPPAGGKDVLPSGEGRFVLMKKEYRLPVFAAVLGLAGFVLRLAENQLFDPLTGLPADSALHWLLPLFLLAAAAFLVLLTRREAFVPAEFEEAYPFAGKGAVVCIVLGAALLLVAAVLQFFSFLLLNEVVLGILGILMLLTAAGLFVVLRDCRKGLTSRSYLLLPGLCLMALLLVAGYRAEVTNSVLLSFYVQVLAQAALLLQYYYLPAAAYAPEKSRPCALFAALSALLCLTAAADGGKLVGGIFYLSQGLLSLGILLGRRTAPAEETK